MNIIIIKRSKINQNIQRKFLNKIEEFFKRLIIQIYEYIELYKDSRLNRISIEKYRK